MLQKNRVVNAGRQDLSSRSFFEKHRSYRRHELGIDGFLLPSGQRIDQATPGGLYSAKVVLYSVHHQYRGFWGKIPDEFDADVAQHELLEF